jgi:hypothetical protein
MLPPHMKLRQVWLRRALRHYPLYDPPHKVEERLLPREKAAENFDYFMRVRGERLDYFQQWLRRNFWVNVTLNEKGVRALSRWGNKYAGLLFAEDATKDPAESFHTYNPPWIGEYAGNNVLFDMAIVFGEIIIATCRRLHWELDPVSAILPRTAERERRYQGSSFQKPLVYGFADPTT